MPPPPPSFFFVQGRSTRHARGTPRSGRPYPGHGAGDWRDRLITVLWSYTRILSSTGLASRCCDQAIRARLPSAWPSILALLSRRRGTPDRPRGRGTALLHVRHLGPPPSQGTRDRAIDARDEEDALAAAWREAPSETFPHIAALGASSRRAGPDAADWVSHVLINGILQTPRPEPATNTTHLPQRLGSRAAIRRTAMLATPEISFPIKRASP